jgi:AraC-like DNA-binding protein
MARLLGLSERTLQRRLAELDRGFSSIVEQFRREEAALLLSDPRVAVVEVAARLGYAEQTSFTRAFRRWTGTTPAAWRREAAG